VEVIEDQRRDHREGIAQNKYGMNKKPKKVEVQFKERFIILDRGSNLENRFVIIFNLVYVMVLKLVLFLFLEEF